MIVGAILGGVSQVIAGSVQRRHERDREKREAKRVAYSEFLRALDGYRFQMVVMESKSQHGKVAEEITRALRSALHLFNTAFANVQIQGASAVCRTTYEIRDITDRSLLDVKAGRTSDRLSGIQSHELRLISAIRRDLKIDS